MGLGFLATNINAFCRKEETRTLIKKPLAVFYMKISNNAREVFFFRIFKKI